MALETPTLISIDIGSIAVSAVQMDIDGTIRESFYVYHKGRIREILNTSMNTLISAPLPIKTPL